MTSITFPLYDNLIKDLDKEEMSQKEQDKFMKLIKLNALLFKRL